VINPRAKDEMRRMIKAGIKTESISIVTGIDINTIRNAKRKHTQIEKHKAAIKAMAAEDFRICPELEVIGRVNGFEWAEVAR